MCSKWTFRHVLSPRSDKTCRNSTVPDTWAVQFDSVCTLYSDILGPVFAGVPMFTVIFLRAGFFHPLARTTLVSLSDPFLCCLVFGATTGMWLFVETSQPSHMVWKTSGRTSVPIWWHLVILGQGEFRTFIRFGHSVVLAFVLLFRLVICFLFNYSILHWLFFRFLFLLFVVFSYVVDIDLYGGWLSIELGNRQFIRDGISGRPAPLTHTSVYTWCMDENWIKNMHFQLSGLFWCFCCCCFAPRKSHSPQYRSRSQRVFKNVYPERPVEPSRMILSWCVMWKGAILDHTRTHTGRNTTSTLKTSIAFFCFDLFLSF